MIRPLGQLGVSLFMEKRGTPTFPEGCLEAVTLAPWRKAGRSKRP